MTNLPNVWLSVISFVFSVVAASVGSALGARTVGSDGESGRLMSGVSNVAGELS